MNELPPAALRPNGGCAQQPPIWPARSAFGTEHMRRLQSRPLCEVAVLLSARVDNAGIHGDDKAAKRQTAEAAVQKCVHTATGILMTALTALKQLSCSLLTL